MASRGMMMQGVALAMVQRKMCWLDTYSGGRRRQTSGREGRKHLRGPVVFILEGENDGDEGRGRDEIVPTQKDELEDPRCR